MPHYKLLYFPGRGKGEMIRQILTVAKQDFEDVRISMMDWDLHKEKMPYHQLPVLEEDGKQLPQSFAIARYLARKYGLAGSSSWEEAQIDALAEQWKDFLNEIQSYVSAEVGMGPGNPERLKEDVFIPAVKKNFPFFEKTLKENGTGYLVGDSLTYVDLPVAEMCANLHQRCAHVFDDWPELRDHYKRVHGNTELKRWRETRPETAF